MTQIFRELGPLTNPWVVGLATAQLLDDAAANQLASLAANGFSPDSQVDRLLASAVMAIEEANSSYFRFELDGVCAPGEPQLVTLQPGQSTSAIDLGLSASQPDRKLTVLLVLPPVDDAPTLHHDQSEKSAQLSPGQIVMTPSYCSLSLGPDAASAASFVAVHAVGRSFR